MRRLILMRHAKSSWDDPALDDFERPLKNRGLRDAPMMGRWLAEQDLKPEKVLCSPALRARMTCELALDALGAAPPVEHIEQLYTFGSPRPLIDAIRKAGGAAETLMLVGHNEALHDLALLLARDGEKKPLKRLRKKFPTAAVAAFELDIDGWEQLSPAATGTLTHYIRPKDLRKNKNG